MRFGVLGPVEAHEGDERLDLGHPVQQCVLAALLVDVGRVVTPDQLVERVWSERLPYRAKHNLYTYISRLRRVVAIDRRQGGYVLDLPPTSVDLHRFRELVADDELDEALGLWRGTPFGEIDTPWFAAVREQLLKERFAAQLRRNDLALGRGRHAELLPELLALAAEHPLDERLAGQLMLALYRDGRQSEALTCYERLRVRLADELGADPSPPLQKLHLSFLSQDPLTVVPRQLPTRPPVFVGRAAELRALDAVGSGVVVIGGPGGFGKTSLAVRWAFDNAGRFPGGQLYVNLRGFDQAAAPLPPAVVLRGFLDALGVLPERVPDDLESRSAMFRDLLADRRVLVVLDNARDEEQVRPLLPGGHESLVIVTSRNRMTGLVASEQARPLTMPVLTDAEAVALLSHRLDPSRLADTEAVTELVRCTGGLPLALAVVAARALARPAFPLRALVGELRDERLDALDAGDPAASVRAVFSWSYHALSDEAAALFRLLGVHCGPDIDVRAATALLGAPARRALAELTRVHLADEHVPGRFWLHDLLRDFAAELATPAESRPALARVLDHYLHTAFAAERRFAPHWPPIDVPSTVRFDEFAQAKAWLDDELPVLLAATDLAVREGFDEHAWQLPWSLSTYLTRCGNWDQRAATQEIALAAASRLGDRSAEAVTRHLLGRAKAVLGDLDGAQADLDAALALHTAEGDGLDAAVTHFSLSNLAARRADFAAALLHTRLAMEFFSANENTAWIAFGHCAFGFYHAMAGNAGAALEHCTEALWRVRELGDLDGEANTLWSLGIVHRQLGDVDEAARCLSHAADLFGQEADLDSEARCADLLGDALAANGDTAGAREAWVRAEALFSRLGHRNLAGVQAKLRS